MSTTFDVYPKSMTIQSDATFRKLTNATALFQKINLRLGKVKNSSQTIISVLNASSKIEVTSRYDTLFSKGSACEEFVYLICEDKPILRDYKISSPLLDVHHDKLNKAKIALSKLLAIFKHGMEEQ
jgi:hypothetical protein